MGRRCKAESEALKVSIEAMLLAGKVTCEIVCDLGVSSSMVSKVRNDLIAKGKGGMWHTDEYLDKKCIRI